MSSVGILYRIFHMSKFSVRFDFEIEVANEDPYEAYMSVKTVASSKGILISRKLAKTCQFMYLWHFCQIARSKIIIQFSVSLALRPFIRRSQNTEHFGSAFENCQKYGYLKFRDSGTLIWFSTEMSWTTFRRFCTSPVECYLHTKISIPVP